MSGSRRSNEKGVPTEAVEPRKVLLLLLLSCYNSIVAINHTLPTFQGYTPHYFCQVDNVSASVEGCVKELNNTVHTPEPSCSAGYQFQSSRGDWTVVTEWQLVCERRFLRPLIATLYFCGVTIGAFVCGFLADRYGRRVTVISCLYAQGLLGVCLYFTASLEAFVAVRFVQGFFVQGLQGATFALLIELFPPKSRTAVAVVIDIYWPLGMMFLAGASYCIPQWRPLQLLLSVPTIATLFYVCLVPESPRWLATHSQRRNRTDVWDRIMHAGQKMVPVDKTSSKPVQLCNEVGCSGNNKELATKLLEKNKNIYRYQNNITNKENNTTKTTENLRSCCAEVEAIDSPSGYQKNTSSKIEEVGNVDLLEKKMANRGENVEIKNPEHQNGDSLSYDESEDVKESEKESTSLHNDNPACLWKEIVSELGYDIEKSLSDIEDSCKKVDEGSSDYDVGILKAVISNEPEWILVGTSCTAACEVSEEFSVGHEEPVTDLDDCITDQQDIVISGDASKQAGLLDLFRSKVLRKYNLIMVLVWFSVAISYYGIMFYLPGLSGERHLNFFLSALLELLSFVLIYFILSKYGRRLPMASFLFITSFSCLTVGAISVIPREDVPWIGDIQTALALLGKSAALACFCTMFLYASELFPTVTRAVAMGHFGFWARIGSLLSPQLVFLGEYTLPAIPLIIIGVMGMLSGICVFALPETLGRQLPDTIEEAEALAHDNNKLFT